MKPFVCGTIDNPHQINAPIDRRHSRNAALARCSQSILVINPGILNPHNYFTCTEIIDFQLLKAGLNSTINLLDTKRLEGHRSDLLVKQLNLYSKSLPSAVNNGTRYPSNPSCYDREPPKLPGQTTQKEHPQ